MATFTIDGKTYTSTELEFKDICRMERDFNVSFANMENKTFSAMNAFFAMSANISADEASKRLQDHVVNGGNFEDIANALGEAMKESRFFQAMQKNREAKASTPLLEQEENKPIDTTATEVSKKR